MEISRFVPVPPIAQAVPHGGAAETGLSPGLPALPDFEVAEQSSLAVLVQFHAGTGAVCSVKINGEEVGRSSHGDGSTTVAGSVELAPGRHSISMRTEAFGGPHRWHDGIIRLVEQS